jgi:glycosyltransferase involved in cell wall biosynthesis
MPIKKLVYLVNARLPTEKAHGYQICKMCEAFAHHALQVMLMHPYRYQPDPSLREQTIFNYYGIERNFQVRALANWDVVRWNMRIPDQPFAIIFFAHALCYGLYAALLARREKADLYYTRDSEFAFWLTRLGLPTVYEAHVVPKHGQLWLLRRMAQDQRLPMIVVLTCFIRERLVQLGFPPEKVLVLPDGVDLSLFHDLPSREACRQRLGLPGDRSIIGYIGRFHTLGNEKGIPELVQTMSYLPVLRGKEPLLLCVGGPMDAVPTYVELACKLGVSERRLQFVDRVPNHEVPLWMRACDVVTIPWPWTEFSAYFTSPLKLFEYMAAGVPIVASDLPSIRQVLRHGENAWLVEPGSHHSLGEGLNMVLGNPSTAQRLAARARSDVLRFTWLERAQTILRRSAKAHGCRS